MDKVIRQKAQYEEFRGNDLPSLFLEIAEWLKSPEGPANIKAIGIDFDHEYLDWTVLVFHSCTFDHSL